MSEYSPCSSVSLRHILSVLVLMVAVILSGCGENNGKSTSAIGKPADLNTPDRKIGVPEGAVAMTVGEKFFNRAQIVYFNSLADGYAAVEYNKIDAFVFDRHSMRYTAKANPKLRLLPGDIAEEHIVIGLPLKNTGLLKKVNDFIREYRANGLYEQMYKRWLESTTHAMPDIPRPATPIGKLKIGTEGLNEPMNYFGSDGKVTGFDVEFIHRLALFLNMDVQIETMTYPALIAATETGQLDMMVANLNHSPERAEKILMTDDYVDSAISVLVRADTASTEKESGVITSLRDLRGKKAASLTGSGFQELTEPLQSGIHHVFFNDNHSSVAALRSGKVDAVLLDKPVAQLFVSCYPEDLTLVSVYAEDNYGFALEKNSRLREPMNQVIRKLEKSGELEKLIVKWCGSDESLKKLENWTHKRDFTGKNGTLRYGSDMTMEPVCYSDSAGNPIGIDVEIMRRIAYELDMNFAFVPMSFGSLIEALISGKIDAAGGSMSITEERQKKVDFSDTYYRGGLTMIARRAAQSKRTGLKELYGKRIGVLSGTTMDAAVKRELPEAMSIYYNNFTDLPIALESGKIDAFLLEEPQFRLMSAERPNLTILTEKLSNDDYAFVFALNQQELCDAFSRQIEAMQADGTLKKLDEKWFSADDSRHTLPPMGDFGGKVLRFATVPQLAPFSFMKNGEAIGYDIEVARLAAAKLGYALEPVILEWSSLIEAVSAGKVDMGGGCITVTAERKQKVHFSKPDYRGGLVVIVLKDTAAPTAKTASANWFAACGASLLDSFDRTFLRENRWKLVLDGLMITVLITVLAAVAGTLLAFPVCFMRSSKRYLPRMAGKLFISLMQGMPILVILMILYYIVFAKIDIDAVIVAIIGFGLNFAAYVGEMLRTGISSVPRGQQEAALALGFSRSKTFWKIIFPQALRQILPVYRGEFINMLKTTSVVGYIAIQDLTKMSDIIRSRTYEAFFPLISTAVIYFVTAWILTLSLTYLEHKLDPLSRRKSVKKETR